VQQKTTPSISIAKLTALRARVAREVAFVGGIGGGGIVDEGVLAAGAIDEVGEARAGRAAICARPFESAAGLPAAAIPSDRDMREFERRIAALLPQQRFGIVDRLRPPIAAASRQRDATRPYPTRLNLRRLKCHPTPQTANNRPKKDR